MWNPFVAGASWQMTSNVNGHVTTFGVRRLARWGCWTGEMADLWDVKQAPQDYWLPGGDVVGHQIMHRDRDGAWRMVGTYGESPSGAGLWTLQMHSFRGRPRAYVITPGTRRGSDVRTAYYLLSRPGVVSTCIKRRESVAPSWARKVYWRSRFTLDTGGDLRAHYEEGRGAACGRFACQAEDWTFARGRVGIARIAVHRSGGQPLSLVLRQTVSQDR